MRPLLFEAIGISGLIWSLSGQGPVPEQSQWTVASRHRAEDQVAAKLESMRTVSRLPKLRRMPPSVAEVQLVCTAARTGTKAHDPASGNLWTYETRNLSAETEALRLVAFGTSQEAKGASRYKVYSDTDWPHYSVVVQFNRGSTQDTPLYTVGVARLQSPLMEFLGRSSFDDPTSDSTDWKKQIDPECRAERP
jgi:hypothetical protein